MTKIKTASLSILFALLACCASAADKWAQPDKVAAVQEGKLVVADAAWWGFDAEDSTRFLQAAFDSPAKRIVVPARESPWIVLPLQINRDDLELVFAQGTVIEAKRGAFLGRNDVILKIWDRRNIVLSGYGATFQMHKRDYWEEPYKRSGWRHCLDIRGSVGVSVYGLTLSNSGGDGIYISSTENLDYSKDIVVRDVVCSENNRQGMSVISAENLLVERSVFRDTIGAAPMAGIDFEPNKPNQRLKNIVVRDSFFLSNSQLGIHAWMGYLSKDSEPVSIICENNYISGGEIGLHVGNLRDDGPSGHIRFRGNIVEATHHAGVLIRRFSAKAPLKVELQDNQLINTASRGPYSDDVLAIYQERFKMPYPRRWWGSNSPSAPILLAAQTHVPTVQGGVSFKNDLIIHDRDEDVVILAAPRGKHTEMFDKEDNPVPSKFEGWKDITGEIKVVNPALREVPKPAVRGKFICDISLELE